MITVRFSLGVDAAEALARPVVGRTACSGAAVPWERGRISFSQKRPSPKSDGAADATNSFQNKFHSVLTLSP